MSEGCLHEGIAAHTQDFPNGSAICKLIYGVHIFRNFEAVDPVNESSGHCFFRRHRCRRGQTSGLLCPMDITHDGEEDCVHEGRQAVFHKRRI